MTEIWFMRHGETDWNTVHRLQGWRDIALNDVGRHQAERLSGRLQQAHLEQPFAAAYTSDLQRTVDTLTPAAVRIGLAPILDQGLRERHYGVLEGFAVSEMAAKAPPEAYAAWLSRDEHGDVGHGETLRQFHDRIISSVQKIADRHAGERILIMTHGGALDIIWRHAHGTALTDKKRRAPMLNVSINRVILDGDHWEVVEWGNVEHMAEPVGNDVVA